MFVLLSMLLLMFLLMLLLLSFVVASLVAALDVSLGVSLVVLLGESEIPEELGINPLQRSVLGLLRLLDSVGVLLSSLVVRRVVLAFGHCIRDHE